MRFLYPLGFAALLAVPVIIFMYLLKQKYKERQIPSLYLWEKVFLQTKAQEPWQKLKRNKLLFLQILAAILLALALASPHIAGSMTASHYIMALDCSLSMQAEDVEGSRFYAAKEEMQKMVEQAPASAKFSVVFLDDTPAMVLSEGEKQAALRVLENAQPGGTGVDWEQAKTILKAQQDATAGEICLFTDQSGVFRELAPEEFVYGNPSENTALTMLSHGETESGQMVLAHLVHYGQESVEKEITLFADDVAIDTKKVTLDANGETDVVFQGIPHGSSALEARMTPTDVLPADDVIYDHMGDGENRKVLLVSEGNLFLEKAFSLMDGVELYLTDGSNMEGLSGYQLYIFDGLLPQSMPQDGYYMIFSPPRSISNLQMGQEIEIGQEVKSGSRSPWENMENLSFVLAKGSTLSADWGTPFLAAQDMPLALYGEPEGRKTIVFGFDLHDSDFPLKMEFPVLMYRLLEWYFPASSEKMEQQKAGEEIQLSLKPSTKKAWIVTPEGEEIQVAPPFPAITLTDTKTAGIYALKETDEEGITTETRFAVNVQTEGESNLLMENQPSQQQNAQKKTGVGSRDLTVMAILLLLAVILIEWRVNCREH